MTTLLSLTHLDPARFETTAILKKTTAAGRLLAELKGVSASIPNRAILINTLALQARTSFCRRNRPVRR